MQSSKLKPLHSSVKTAGEALSCISLLLILGQYSSFIPFFELKVFYKINVYIIMLFTLVFFSSVALPCLPQASSGMVNATSYPYPYERWPSTSPDATNPFCHPRFMFPPMAQSTYPFPLYVPPYSFSSSSGFSASSLMSHLSLAFSSPDYTSANQAYVTNEAGLRQNNARSKFEAMKYEGT